MAQPLPANHFRKDPDAVKDYSVDWGTWLDGDTITASTWTADDGITVDSDENDTTTATVWLSGGALEDEKYRLINHITTAAGREDDQSIWIHMVIK
jgi:hypothetical protein